MGRDACSIMIDLAQGVFLEIKGFVEKNGIIPVDDIQQIKNGRNSQVYIIEQLNNKWIVKNYHRHANDERNRLENEFGFLTFLANNEMNIVAKPIAFDMVKNLGLFSYLPGVLPKTIDGKYVDQACDFIKQINKTKFRKSAKGLPIASEACFSIISHINCVKKRVARLNKIIPSSPLQNDVSAFVQSSLVSSLNKITKYIYGKFSDKKMQEYLMKGSQIISPSDFGFQNTIVDKGTLYFLDFEYAGWDDPAKLICDFGCHPEIPIKDDYLQKFKDSFNSWLKNAELSI